MTRIWTFGVLRMAVFMYEFHLVKQEASIFLTPFMQANGCMNLWNFYTPLYLIVSDVPESLRIQIRQAK